MNYPKDFDKNLIKRIEVEQKFADYIYKEFRTKRYGLAPCCSLSQMDKYKIKKELCDWQDLKIKTYSSTTYEEINFYPIPENNPDLFDSETITTTTTLPDTTYTTTILVPGEPIYQIEDCINNCIYPPVFKPTVTQLKNLSTDFPGDDIEATAGPGELGMENGRNSILKFSQQDLEFIPNTSGRAQVSLYSKIDVGRYLLEFYMMEQWGVMGIDFPTVAMWVNDYYASGQVNYQNLFQNYNLPPASAYQEWLSNNDAHYYALMAQFTLLPAPNAEGPTSGVKLAWTYKDPVLEADGYGNNFYEEIDLNGVTYYAGSLEAEDPSYATTLFGNERPFKQIQNNQNNWYALNGGLYYPITQSNETQMMRAVVVDENDVYQTDFLIPGSGTLLTGMADPSVYYYSDSSLAGDFQGDSSFSWEVPYIWEPLSTTDLRQPSCSFSWGVGTISNFLNIGPDGTLIEPGSLDTRCTYIGIETFEEEVITVTEEGETITTTETFYECKTDNEYIVFKVYNQTGNPVKGYEIIVNGGNIGKTNENGIFKTIIENASVKTKHTLNICHCFTTTGACTQKEIKIIVNDDDITNVTIDKVDCTPISSSD
jgi:hypothetical protein